MNLVTQGQDIETARRYGGELPLGCDPLATTAAELPKNVLAFSHGRAALSWFISTRGPFESAAICAYTCPTVPQLLTSEGLDVGFFDYSGLDIADLARSLPGKTLVLLPAPFGMAPWVDADELAIELKGHATVVIDAAQSAFGHIEFLVPLEGAVLSCPRKALAIGDGALLALSEVLQHEREQVAELPVPDKASRLRQEARRLFAMGDVEYEQEALSASIRAEDTLPTAPHRMCEESLSAFLAVDAIAHRNVRRENAARLRTNLDGLPTPELSHEGTPFNFPVLVDSRDALIDKLHQKRLFATALWPDSVHDPVQHPIAAEYAHRLLALPVDQRYGPTDMDHITDIVLSCL